MKILVRVDAGGEIGLGHYFRTMSLCNALNSRGHQLQICHRESEFWTSIAPIAGITLTSMPETTEEAIQLDILRSMQPDVFFVDGLIDFSQEFLHEAKKHSRLVFYHNMREAGRYADDFIYPSIHPIEGYISKTHYTGNIYQGLEYLIINDEILALSKDPRFAAATKISRICISTGGTDPKNVLHTLYQKIDHERFTNIKFIYLFGIGYLHASSIPAAAPGNVRFEPYRSITIAESDMVIAAFGMTVYECMMLGKLVLSVGHQPSNSAVSKKIADTTHGIFHIGDVAEIGSIDLNEIIAALLQNDRKTDSLRHHAKTAIDGNGLHRIIEIIEKH